jgi:hypothetical protein
MAVIKLSPLDSVTETLRDRSHAPLHARLGVRPYVFTVRQAGKAHLVRIRALASNLGAARNKVSQLIPKATEIVAIEA